MSAFRLNGRERVTEGRSLERKKAFVSEAEKLVIPACGVAVFESRHACGRSGEIKDIYPKFFLVISGHAQCEVGGRRYSMGPDTLCHIPARQGHYQETRANESVLTYVIRYRSDLLSSAINSQLTALGMISVDLSTTSMNHARVVKALFQEMLFEQEACQGGWEGLLQSRLIEL